MSPKPWTRSAFELLWHAEQHFKEGNDFDRRISFVGFDNAIEVSVVTFLSLNPELRNGQSFDKEEVRKWTASFANKVAFLEQHADRQGISMAVERSELLYLHYRRNTLYHGSEGLVPTLVDLNRIRLAAIWTFSILFDCDAETMLSATAHARNGDLERAKKAAQETPEPQSDTTNFLQAFLAAQQAALAVLKMHGAKPNIKAAVEAAPTPLLNECRLENLTSPDVSNILARAEVIAEHLLTTESIEAPSADLRSLAVALEVIAANLNQQLKDHQKTVAIKALEATLAATVDLRAGVITQPPGTGLTISLLSFLALCNEDSRWMSLRRFIVTDRRDLTFSFANAYHEFFNSASKEQMFVPQDSCELERCLSSPECRVILGTAQQFARLKKPVEEACLLVGYDLHTSQRGIVSCFPYAVRILFTTAARHLNINSDTTGIFGEPICSYGYSDAVRDGHLLELTPIERLITTQSPRSESIGAHRLVLSASKIDQIVKEICTDLDCSSQNRPLRVLIVVETLDSASAFSAALKSEAESRTHDLLKNAYIESLTSQTRAEERMEMLSQLNSLSDTAVIAVVTAAFCVGLRVPAVSRCYVTCRVSLSEFNSLRSNVTQPYLGKSTGTIVDFVGSVKDHAWYVN
jgi:hypothetical protein